MAEGSSVSRGEPQGRFARTALLSLLAVLLGAVLFDDVDDAGSTAAFFVLVVLATSALTAELTMQAQRGVSSTNGWSRSDTGIVVSLVVVAGLTLRAVAFGNKPATQQTAGICFVALYVLLVAYFGFVRWRSLRRGRG